MPDRDVRLYFSDIQDSGEAIVEYISGLSYEEFCEDRKTYSAVIREFEIIGEAVNKIPDDIKQYHQNVQWKDIKVIPNPFDLSKNGVI